MQQSRTRCCTSDARRAGVQEEATRATRATSNSNRAELLVGRQSATHLRASASTCASPRSAACTTICAMAPTMAAVELLSAPPDSGSRKPEAPLRRAGDPQLSPVPHLPNLSPRMAPQMRQMNSFRQEAAEC